MSDTSQIWIESPLRLLAYDAWANHETLMSLRGAADPPERALKTMFHVVSTAWLWLARIEGVPSPLPIWPEMALDEAQRKYDEIAGSWRRYLDAMEPGGYDRRVIEYMNSKGDTFESSVRDIITHLVFHGAYHRGQIASALRAAGFAPAYTDFIHASRSGIV